MAFEPHTADDIVFIAESFKDVSDKLFAVAKKMREEKVAEVTLQLKSVRDHYLPVCEKLASDVDMHFKNQLRCQKTGETPMWQKSVQKAAYNKALRQAKENVESRGLVKPAKKATKKKGS